MTRNNDVNFKRPCWVTVYIMLGMAVVDYGCLMAANPEKGTPGMEIVIGSLMTMFAGIVGFGLTLVWWCAAAIVSAVSRRHPKRPDSKTISN
jgi:hypothetical protein